VTVTATALRLPAGCLDRDECSYLLAAARIDSSRDERESGSLLRHVLVEPVDICALVAGILQLGVG